MVAKSYASYEIIGEPFREKGRMYVKIAMPKGEKKVRWYSDIEYHRMYPEEPKKDLMDFNARYAFGFRDEGFITLYKGDEKTIRDWAQDVYPPRAWHNLTFQFYTPGFMPVENLPQGITQIKLTWDEVKQDDIRMKPHEEVSKYVEKLLISQTASKSKYQGAKNDWITKKVYVRENRQHEDRFGEKHTHFMCDAEGNTYVWETSTKNFENGMELSLKMKVKEHKEIEGEQTTIVWYCKEV